MSSLQSMKVEGAEGQVSQLLSEQSQRPISVASRISTTPGAITPIIHKQSDRSDPSFLDVNSHPQTVHSMRTITREKTPLNEETDGGREMTFVTHTTNTQQSQRLRQVFIEIMQYAFTQFSSFKMVFLNCFFCNIGVISIIL